LIEKLGRSLRRTGGHELSGGHELVMSRKILLLARELDEALEQEQKLGSSNVGERLYSLENHLSNVVVILAYFNVHISGGAACLGGLMPNFAKSLQFLITCHLYWTQFS
jgi:hypothetical protein